MNSSGIRNPSAVNGVREAMTDFWQEHSRDASVEEMMLDSNAEELTKHELPEILSYLPSWEGKDVLELGAGIGRFTGELASSANHVIAFDFMEKFIKKNQEMNSQYSNIDFKCADVTKMKVDTNSRFTGELASSANHVIAFDFMEKFIKKNQEMNSQYSNIDFKCADVTKMKVDTNSVDLIFSNWLLMYLGDEEVQNLVQRELSWLKDGGYFFARESCCKSSGDIKRMENPTKYRDPSLYLAMFTMITIPTETDGEVYGFELVMSRSLRTYIELKQNQNQVVWLLQKSRRKTVNNNSHKTDIQIHLNGKKLEENK